MYIMFVGVAVFHTACMSVITLALRSSFSLLGFHLTPIYNQLHTLQYAMFSQPQTTECNQRNGGTSPSLANTILDFRFNSSPGPRLQSRPDCKLNSSFDSRLNFSLDSRLQSSLDFQLISKLDSGLHFSLDSRTQPRFPANFQTRFQTKFQPRFQAEFYRRFHPSVTGIFNNPECRPTALTHRVWCC